MKEQTKLEYVVDAKSVKIVVSLADEIWRQHYTDIIGKEQVDYMLEKFQSFHAITKQIEDGVDYYLLNYGAEPAGYISFYPKDDKLFISKIYVKDKLRGRGLGKQAMELAIKEAKKLGLSGISLTVNKNNTHTIAAYEKMNFRKVKAVVMDIGNGFVMDDFIMEKQL